jgi:hypothetical protein
MTAPQDLATLITSQASLTVTRKVVKLDGRLHGHGSFCHALLLAALWLTNAASVFCGTPAQSENGMLLDTIVESSILL